MLRTPFYRLQINVSSCNVSTFQGPESTKKEKCRDNNIETSTLLFVPFTIWHNGPMEVCAGQICACKFRAI